MSVTNISRNIYKELSSDPVDWLLGNAGDKIRIETTFTVETFAISSTKNPFIVNAKDGYLGSGWVVDRRGQFRDFKIGDTVIYFDRFDNRHDIKTIVDKKSDNEVQFDSAFSGFTDDDPEPNFVFSITVPITAVSYNWNFIENSDSVSFNSLVDGSVQELVAQIVDAGSTAPVDMVFLGVKDYQIGSATIQGVSIDDGTTDGVYKSIFKIIHHTFITPMMLADEIVGPELPTNTPAYFADKKCLKLITHIEALYDYTDPNRMQIGEESEGLGNTGGWNENFNTGLTNYSSDRPVYKNGAGDVVSALQLTQDPTTCRVVINNTIDAPFSSDTKFVLNIIKMPISNIEYKGVGKTMDENLLFDRALQTVSAGAVNGDQYGTGRQIIKNLTATLISSSRVQIDFTALMGNDVFGNLNTSQTPSYRLWVSVQNHTLATDVSDLVNLRIEDYQQFFIDTSDPDMVVLAPTVMLRHPETDPDTQGITPGTVDAFNPFLSWQAAVTGTPKLVIVDETNNKTIGCADWQGSLGDTLSKLNDSINTNTNFGTLPFGDPAFSNAAGYTAQWYPDFSDILTVAAPAGSNAAANGIELFLGYEGGSMSVESWPNGNISTETNSPGIEFTGGVDASVITMDVYPEDEVVAYSKFYIDLNGRSTDVIKLQSIESRIKVRNSVTKEEFTLDEFDLNLSTYPYVGPVQNFDFSTDRIFHIPEGTIRKQILVQRRSDLDGGNLYYFEAWYPFLVRWEYWTSLMGVNSAFFNAAQPNQGFNEFWYHYSQVANWGLYHETVVTALKNGARQQYPFETPIALHDWQSNADYAPYDNAHSCIRAFDNDTNTELFDVTSGKKFIQGYKNTRIEANFCRVSVAPTLDNCTVNVRIEVYEQGGISGSRRMSSKWPSDNDTWFLSMVGDFKTQLSLAGHTLTGKCLVDFSNIPGAAKFKISARLYQLDGEAIGKITEDGQQKLTEDGTFKIIE